MVNQTPLGDVNLPAFYESRNGYDNGKVFYITLEIVSHRNDGSVLVANKDDLGRPVEKGGVGPGDKKATKGESVCTDSQRNGSRNYHDQVTHAHAPR